MQLLRTIYRVSNFCYRRRLNLFSKIIDGVNYLLFNSFVPGQCQIGRNTIFGKGGIGVVIHQRAKIGRNCIIGQGITIGGRTKQKEVPVIGDKVYLGAGCRVLGPIKIGDNVVIGPNAVVLKDIPSGCVVVGIPGRIIKENIKMEEMI